MIHKDVRYDVEEMLNKAQALMKRACGRIRKVDKNTIACDKEKSGVAEEIEVAYQEATVAGASLWNALIELRKDRR